MQHRHEDFLALLIPLAHTILDDREPPVSPHFPRRRSNTLRGVPLLTRHLHVLIAPTVDG
jgi:hypothetical protein